MSETYPRTPVALSTNNLLCLFHALCPSEIYSAPSNVTQMIYPVLMVMLIVLKQKKKFVCVCVCVYYLAGPRSVTEA